MNTTIEHFNGGISQLFDNVIKQSSDKIIENFNTIKCNFVTDIVKNFSYSPTYTPDFGKIQLAPEFGYLQKYFHRNEYPISLFRNEHYRLGHITQVNSLIVTNYGTTFVMIINPHATAGIQPEIDYSNYSDFVQHYDQIAIKKHRLDHSYALHPSKYFSKWSVSGTAIIRGNQIIYPDDIITLVKGLFGLIPERHEAREGEYYSNYSLMEILKACEIIHESIPKIFDMTITQMHHYQTKCENLKIANAELLEQIKQMNALIEQMNMIIK